MKAVAKYLHYRYIRTCIPVSEDEDGGDAAEMGAVIEDEDVCCAEDVPSLGSNNFKQSEEH